MHVNSTNKNLDLSMGALAPAVLKAAGPSLQAECNEKAPVLDGDVAITGAGKLPSRYVFHTVVPTHDGPGGKAEKVNIYIDSLSPLQFCISILGEA